MPFPWKKAKGKKFSQLLTNHLAPPKHGASLLVETGFPTSLADLFVKNRDRFNNNNNDDNNNDDNNDIVVNKRKKKKKKRASPSGAPISIPLLSASPDHGPTQNSIGLSASSISQPVTPPRHLSIPQIPDDDGIVACGGSDHDRANHKLVNGKHVFTVVLKMFFVVMLALGANKFAVGIGLSAFLLLSMEYVGRRLGGLFMTSASARWTTSSYLVELLKRYKKLVVGLKGCCAGSVEVPIEEIQFDSNLASSKAYLGYPSTCPMNDLVSEIHVVQPSFNLVSLIGEIPSVKGEFNFQHGKEKWATEEMAEKVEEEVIEKKKQEVCQLLLCDDNTGKVLRGSKIRSKIKKFAKKLNYSKLKQKKKKKEANESKCDASFSGNAKMKDWDEKGRESEVISNDDFTSLSSSLSGGSSDGDQVNVEDSICLENGSDSIKDGGREWHSSSRGYLAILVIVLAGLVGGRVVALAFALSWFLLLKLGLGTRLRYIANSCWRYYVHG